MSLPSLSTERSRFDAMIRTLQHHLTLSTADSCYVMATQLREIAGYPTRLFFEPMIVDGVISVNDAPAWQIYPRPLDVVQSCCDLYNAQRPRHTPTEPVLLREALQETLDRTREAMSYVGWSR